MGPNYRGHRFPAEIISHAVWLYHRFTLSFRDVEDLLAARGIIVCFATVLLQTGERRPAPAEQNTTGAYSVSELLNRP